MFQIEAIKQAGETVNAIQLYGAGGFGALIGWYVYYINRYRRSEVQLSDLVTVIGVIGGAAILALFPAGSMLFGAYGIGLAFGFFGYFLVLVVLVTSSKNFDVDWFLDGRRKLPSGRVMIPDVGEPAAGGQGMVVTETPTTGPQ